MDRRIQNDDELQHFGVKGMKWGVRRYQNNDGSLTSEGRKQKKKLTDKQKKMAKRVLVGAAAAGTAYVGYKYLKNNPQARAKLANAASQTKQRVKTAPRDIQKLAKKGYSSSKATIKREYENSKENFKVNRERNRAYRERYKMSTKDLNNLASRINAENKLKEALRNSQGDVKRQIQQSLVNATAGAILSGAVAYTTSGSVRETINSAVDSGLNRAGVNKANKRKNKHK